MGNSADELSAYVLDADVNALTIEFREDRPSVGMRYMVGGFGQQFLAGKVMWVRGSKAGLFFQPPLQPDALHRLRTSPTEMLKISLRPLGQPRT
jgi:hypothetical protein